MLEHLEDYYNKDFEFSICPSYTSNTAALVPETLLPMPLNYQMLPLGFSYLNQISIT